MKILKKVIALILIQAFLCMNVAFAGGIELLSNIDQNQQSSTLSPQAQISAAQFQSAFDLMHRKYEYLETIEEKRKDQPRPSKNVLNPMRALSSIFDRLIESSNPVISVLVRLIKKIVNNGRVAGELIKQGNIASGTWSQKHHKEFNSLIKSLINNKKTDVTGNYDVTAQKQELINSLTEYISFLDDAAKEKWSKVIQESDLSISSIDELINRIIEILPENTTNFYYLKPVQGVFYLSRANGLPPLIAAAHFGHRRKSKTESKVNNNVYIAEPSFALKSYETQLGVILHELIHCILGAGDAEHAFADRLQSSYEGFMLRKQVPADLLNKYRRYYELKNEILEANKSNDNKAYRKARREFIDTIDSLRALIENTSHEQFQKAFDLLRIEQIENQDEKTFMLGTFDEFYHLSTPDYDSEEMKVMEDIMSDMSEGFKKWHDPDKTYKEGMRAMRPYHAKNLLPESIDEKDATHKQYVSMHVDQITKGFVNAKTTGAAFLRGTDYHYVLTKGLKNRDISLPFLKASIKHELIHYFAFKGLLPIQYNREDITTAMTVIELLENKEEDVFVKYESLFTPVGEKLFEAGREMQREGKVFLDEEYLLKTAFEIFQTDVRTQDQAIYLVRDPSGATPEETARIMQQINDMRQRVIGVIMAGVLMEHHQSTAEPILETLIEFFKELTDSMPLPSITELEQAIEMYKSHNAPQREIKQLEGMLEKARKRKVKVETIKTNIMNWAKRATGIPRLSYVEAKEDMAQWAFLPSHERIVGVESDLYRVDQRAAYGFVVAPVFEAKYGFSVRESIIEEEYKEELYFDLLMRIMDTPRIMAFGWNEYPGTMNWVMAIFAERFKEDNMLIAQTLLGARSRPLQYLDSFMYRFGLGRSEDKRLKNKDVIRAIGATRGALEEVTKVMDEKTVKKPEEIYKIVKEEIWPEFKKLLDAEFKEKKEMEAFRQEHQQPHMSDQSVQDMWDAMTDQERQQMRDEIENRWNSLSGSEKEEVLKQIEKQMQDEANDYMAQASRAQQGKQRTSPNPMMPDSDASGEGPRLPQQGNGNDDLERMNRMAQQLNRMAERMRKKAEDLQNQAKGSSGNVDSLSDKADDIDHNIGGADMSGAGKDLVKTAKDTADGFGSLKNQTDKFKKRADSLNNAAKGAKGTKSSDAMRRSAESLNNTAGVMDNVAGRAEKAAKEALDEAKEATKMISQKGSKNIDQIRDKANNISKKADKLADYAKELADKAHKAGNEAQQSQNIASQMEAETAGEQKGKPDQGKQNGQKPAPENWNWDESKPQKFDSGDGQDGQDQGKTGKPDSKEGKDSKGKSEGQSKTGKPDAAEGKDPKGNSDQDQARGRSKAQDTQTGGAKNQPGKHSDELPESPQDIDREGEVALQGIDKLAKQFKDDNKPDADEFDLSKYDKKDLKGSSKDQHPRPSQQKNNQQPTEEEKADLKKHNKKMNKLRAEKFLKRTGITVDQHKWYQDVKRYMMAQTSNIEKELQKILVPGGGNEFLYHRSYGELDDDALAEIPAGRRKIFKQQMMPKKKKVIICLLVDISSSTFSNEGESLEDSILFREALTALAFQEALKKFENRSDVELQFEIAAYNEYSYHRLKDYKDKLTIKRAFDVIKNILSITDGSGGTSDYQALKDAIKRMRATSLGKDPEAKKIILNMTDGNAGSNSEAIQKLYIENKDMRILSFGIAEAEEVAKSIAVSYGTRFGIAISDIKNVAKVVMKHLRLELRKPVTKYNLGTIAANVLLFGMPALAALTMKTLHGITLNLLGKAVVLPMEEPVYEGSKFLIVRENGKEYLVYRDPDTGEEKIKIERGAHNNKLVPDIEWNQAFENEQNIGTLIHMLQILYAEDGQKDDVMRNLLLVGEAGTGKDVLAEYAVKLLNRNRRVLSIHKRTDKNQLVARRIFFT
ncbi:MAG: AAA family ATPase, partial [Candidatus Omnitrophica bacterium]|nr:AAA family ATPase [Candidatus Omnitrophota bacterium]